MANISKAQKHREEKLKAIKEFLIKGEVVIGCLRFAVGQYDRTIAFFVEQENDNKTKKELIALHTRLSNIIAEYENLLDTTFDDYEVLNKSRVDTDVVKTANKIMRGLGK